MTLAEYITRLPWLQQDVLNAVSIMALTCTLLASLRIIFHRWMGVPKSKIVRFLVNPLWCASLFFFVPWTVAGFAKGEIPSAPWQAFAEYQSNGLLDASAFFLCVLVVDLWMFVAAGQLLTKMQNNAIDLSEEEKRSNAMFYLVVNLGVGFLVVMQIGNLYHLFQNIGGVTTDFIIAISLLALFFHARFTPAIVAKSPAILTTCGILGTFFGIALGLMDFDAANVQRSVPALIDGIKTAFWASAVGIFFALTVKLREVFFGGRSVKRSRATIDDLAKSMNAVQQALTNNDEQSLYGQMVQSRQDSNARLDALAQLLETFIAQQGGVANKEAKQLHLIQEPHTRTKP